MTNQEIRDLAFDWLSKCGREFKFPRSVMPHEILKQVSLAANLPIQNCHGKGKTYKAILFIIRNNLPKYSPPIGPEPKKQRRTKPIQAETVQTNKTTGLYMIRLAKGGVAHIWDGEDTYCRMFSTGGMSKRMVSLEPHPGSRQICKLCLSVKSKPATTKPVHATVKKAPTPKKPSTDFYFSDEWRALRYKALELQGGTCQCCGMSRKKHGVVLHVDHIKPRSKFPELELELSNLQVLCEACNMGKSNKFQTDWR